MLRSQLAWLVKGVWVDDRKNEGVALCPSALIPSVMKRVRALTRPLTPRLFHLIPLFLPLHSCPSYFSNRYLIQVLETLTRQNLFHLYVATKAVPFGAFQTLNPLRPPYFRSHLICIVSLFRASALCLVSIHTPQAVRLTFVLVGWRKKVMEGGSTKVQA